MSLLSICFLVGLLSVAYSLPLNAAVAADSITSCEPGEKTCSKCYDVLVNEIISSDRNRYNLQNAFFPPDSANPVFVTVTYYFTRNMTGDGTTNYSLTSPNQTWFWTQSTFYLFQPIESLQYTSLLFSDTLLRQNYVSLYLQPDCQHTDPKILNFFTERLKLYAMQQRVLSPITDSYSARGGSLITLTMFHEGQIPALAGSEIFTKYGFAFQIVFPLIVWLGLFWLAQHLIENNNNSFFAKIREYIKNSNWTDSKEEFKDGIDNVKVSARNMHILMLVIWSILFVLYVICLDIVAIKDRNEVSAEIFYKPHRNQSEYVEAFVLEYSVVYVFLFYDFVIFSIVIGGLISRCCGWKRSWYYMGIAPLSCIIVHSYHILIGFIHTPHHALSILIFYAIVVLVFYVSLKAAYYNIFHLYRKCNCKRIKCCNLTCCSCKQASKKYCAAYKLSHQIVVALMGSLAVFLALVVVFVVLLFILVPIKMAIDDAPARLLSINQTVLVFIGAAITYKLYRNNKNSSNIVERLAKANKDYLKANVHYGVNTLEDWNDLEAADKEVEMEKLMISALHKVHSPHPSPFPALVAPTQAFAQVLTQLWHLTKLQPIQHFLSEDQNQPMIKTLIHALFQVKYCAKILADEILSQVINVPARARIQGLAVAPTQAQALDQAQTLAQVQAQAQAILLSLPVLENEMEGAAEPAVSYGSIQGGGDQVEQNRPLPPPLDCLDPNRPSPPILPPILLPNVETSPPTKALAAALTKVKQAAKDIASALLPRQLDSYLAAFRQNLEQVEAQAQALVNVLDPLHTADTPGPRPNYRCESSV